MATNEKKKIPVKEELWATPTSPGEEPQLIGSKCPSCGEVYFPKMLKGWCVHCQQPGLEDIKLSRKGKIASFTVIMQPPAGGFYKGPVPYAYGWVDLPEEVRVETLFTGCDFEELKAGKDFTELEPGADVELVIEKVFDDDEGNEVMTHKFKPVKK